MPYTEDGGIYYEVHGSGAPLLLAFPIIPSAAAVFGSGAAGMVPGFLERLTDRFQVLLVDYPSIGNSPTIPPAELTADRVCADMLAVASHAGFEKFAWWGYAWGGVVGLQLAARTDRLTALVVGGWTPLDGQFADMYQATLNNLDDPSPSSRAALRDPKQYAQWVTFYGSLQSWSDRGETPRIACPKLVFVGADSDEPTGGIMMHYASTVHARRQELEGMGWTVHEIAGARHEVGLQPDIVAPIVRPFLEQALLG